jgi:hypothetical protein
MRHMRHWQVVSAVCAVTLVAGIAAACERTSAAEAPFSVTAAEGERALSSDHGVAQPGGDSSQSTPFVVDVWTSKGGQGPGAYGGSFGTGEDLAVYIVANHDCSASVIIAPLDEAPNTIMDIELEADVVRSITPKGTAEDLVGTWQVEVDAVAGNSYASDITVFTIGAVVLSVPLSVDVWTDKGGRGIGLPGGSYLLGESTTIWIEVSADCQVDWSLSGPGGSGSDTAYLQAGAYSMQLGQAEAVDAGTWAVTVQASVAGQMASDIVGFAVLPFQSGTPPQPTEPSGLQPRGQAPPRTYVTPDSATELDALIALKMAKGALPPDASMDVNGDGQVTVDDARLILLAAVA